jgi:CDP-glycerol glycerophosphotransferase
VVVLCNVFCSRKGCGYFPYSLLQGAQFVQLWHGIPLKQIGLECLYAPRFYNQDVAESLAASGPFDAFVGGSAATREEWARRFVFRNYAPIGWPRTDVFFREPTPHDLINVDMEIFHAVKAASNAGRRVILYAPTFHEHKLGVWLEDANIEAMAARCAAKDWMLCVNLHPMEGGWVQQYRRRWPQVRFVAPQTDIYPIVRYASALVTDYSSLAFDYLLLDRPIVFYRPDHEEYVKYSRNLISNADDYTCGAVTENLFDLMQALTDTLSEQDPHRAARVALRQKLYDFTDGRAGERLNRLIMEHVEAKAQASALRP